MINKNHSEWLKLIAVVAMLIDHIGVVLYPDVATFRMIGRLSYPLFAFQIAVGLSCTNNLALYRKRIILFAFIAQIPYSLAFDTLTLNVLFTFSVAVLLLSIQSHLKWFLILVPFIVPMDGEWFGVLSVICFYAFMKERWKMHLAAGAVFIGLSLYLDWWIQMLSLLSLIFIAVDQFPAMKWRLPKKFFYWFYPMHLGVLWLVSLIW